MPEVLLGRIWRTRSLSWFTFDTTRFDTHEYEHNGSLMNGGLYEVLPDKFVAFRGPRDLPSGNTWHDVHSADGALLCREFSPQYYVENLNLKTTRLR
jgi:hypothetical protein